MIDRRYPQNWREVGVALAQLRGEEPRRSLASRTGIPQATLARYEAGAAITIERGRRLDRALGARGVFEASVTRLGQPGWKPLERDEARSSHAHNWPAKHDGDVWILVYPASRNAGRVHDIRCSWGPWRLRLDRALGPDGLALITGKGKDEVSVTCGVRVIPDAHVLFGVDEPATRPREDVGSQWVHMSEYQD